MAIKLCILDARLILNYFHHNYSLPKISACIARHIQSQSLIGTWISFHIKKISVHQIRIPYELLYTTQLQRCNQCTQVNLSMQYIIIKGLGKYVLNSHAVLAAALQVCK